MAPLPAAALGVLSGVLLLLATKQIRLGNKAAQILISVASFILSIIVAGYAAGPFSEMAGARLLPLWGLYLFGAYLFRKFLAHYSRGNSTHGI